MTYSFTVRIDEDALLGFYRDIMQSKHRPLTHRWWFYLLVFAVVIVGLSLKTLTDEATPGVALAVFFILVVVFTVFFVHDRRSTRKAFLKPLETSDPEELTSSYQVSDEGIFVRGKHGEGLSRWSAFSKLLIGRETLVLFIGGLSEFVLPRSALTPEIAAFIEQHCRDAGARIEYTRGAVARNSRQEK